MSKPDIKRKAEHINFFNYARFFESPEFKAKNLKTTNNKDESSDLHGFKEDRNDVGREEGERKDKEGSILAEETLLNWYIYKNIRQLVGSIGTYLLSYPNLTFVGISKSIIANLEAWNNLYLEITNIITTKNEKKACILYFAYKNKLVYVSALKKIFPLANRNTISGVFDSLKKKGLIKDVDANKKNEFERERRPINTLSIFAKACYYDSIAYSAEDEVKELEYHKKVKREF